MIREDGSSRLFALMDPFDYLSTNQRQTIVSTTKYTDQGSIEMATSFRTSNTGSVCFWPPFFDTILYSTAPSIQSFKQEYISRQQRYPDTCQRWVACEKSERWRWWCWLAWTCWWWSTTASPWGTLPIHRCNAIRGRSRRRWNWDTGWMRLEKHLRCEGSERKKFWPPRGGWSGRGGDCSAWRCKNESTVNRIDHVNKVLMKSGSHQHLQVDALPDADNGGTQRVDKTKQFKSVW